MGGSELLEGRNSAVQDMTGVEGDVLKPSQPSDSSDLPASKTTVQDTAVADDHHRRSGRARTVRVKDGFFESSLL
jgi:hypothetical protein